MRIMKKKEYEAVSFAVNQLENEIEGATDEIFIEEASLHLHALYCMMNKYHEQRQKAFIKRMNKNEQKKRNIK